MINVAIVCTVTLELFDFTEIKLVFDKNVWYFGSSVEFGNGNIN